MTQCSATSKQSGERCKRAATPGATVCVMHGGRAPQTRAAAARNLQAAKAREAANKLGIALDVSPQQALLDEVQRAAGMVAYYGQRVAEIAEDAARLVNGVTRVEQRDNGLQPQTTKTVEATPNVWLQLWNEERDRLARVANMAIRAGIEERRVQLAEAQGALIADVIRRILDRLNLTRDQQALVGEVVPQELRALTAA